ncbi:SDR family NAD(P)-dependent oxidoreductase [Streptosporangium carneum]|uniref:3-oxoacyl-ACP reductase n=1 Tax=Streptosporangium carneum TaxID=47481 RepID=A0A9W6I2E7_9ACTN|nr:SDR family oxidoreductase [Streptosporangium carneum]GLK10004.1 3-oxoacyl-ACP reductase [Streptosporangium carneum]
MSSLAGRTALVTGGSRGIGAAVALRLAEAGADVALTYARSADRARDVVAEIRALGRGGLAIEADAADPASAAHAVERTVAEFGRIDVLVNNAGVLHYGPLEQATIEEVDHTLAVHTRAAFLTSQAAARHMGAGGRIISIGSSLAERVPYPGFTLYAMSKAALNGLTKGLARDLGPRGITANVVHPGSTDTEMNPADGPDAEAEKAFAAVGRYGTVGDVAAMVVHLAGEGGAFVTGAAIAVDGGFAA